MSPLPTLLMTALVGAAACGSAPTPVRPDGVPAFQGDFVPVDDTGTDPAFAAFAAELHAVVAARDTSGLLGHVAPGARLSFDDAPGGPAGLRARWFSGGAEPSLWEVLERVCALGFVAEEDAFTAPFVFALWPSDADPFAHVAVPGRDVPARAEPGGEVVARLSTMVVPILAPRRGDAWQIRLPTGEAAWLDAADVVSPLGWRLSLWPDADGAWRIQSFLSSD